MSVFMDDDFLLDTPSARTLYHEYAEGCPIYDYHNHLSPKDIAEHRRFHNLTELWLEGDHYKWRALRACGVEERLVTGEAEPYEKFEAWACVLPRLVGSPLYHWTHMELQRYFGIFEQLSAATAKSIWDRTKEMLEGTGFDAVSLVEKMNVKVLCTTDDPADDLSWHKRIRADESIPFRVLPSFRPDRYLDGNAASDSALCEKYGAKDLLTALERALDFFRENGCRVSDHGVNKFPYLTDKVFLQRIRWLGTAYAQRGIVMQMHMGSIRNNSPRLRKLVGADAGGDSVGCVTDPAALGAFLGDLERDKRLPRAILYNLNPADNTMLSTMAGNFAPKIQFGAAWWFNDHIRGIETQIDVLMEAGTLAASVGMLTDSRSLTSFVRHEYYRRILCAKLGRLIAAGQYPDNTAVLGELVADVCYRNAEKFFGF